MNWRDRLLILLVFFILIKTGGSEFGQAVRAASDTARVKYREE